MSGFLFGVIVAAAGALSAQTPAQPAPPVIDMALRMVRAGSGGSSIAQSAARGDEEAVVYAGLGPCIIGAAREDPANEHSMSWRASGRIRSVERGIAVADVEWQRVEYRPTGVVAGPRVRTTLRLPIGERLAVDVVDASASPCRMDALIFEIGAATDRGSRLSMAAEGRSVAAASGAGASGVGGARAGGAGGGGGAGMGRNLTTTEIEAQADRRRQAAEAIRASSVVNRPMPPRQYTVDVWLVPGVENGALAQRLSQTVGGTGGRFAFPPIAGETTSLRSVAVEISALVIPVDGELVVAITRRATPNDDSPPASAGWMKTVPMPKADAVLSFEIPAPKGAEAAVVPPQDLGLRVRIVQR